MFKNGKFRFRGGGPFVDLEQNKNPIFHPKCRMPHYKYWAYYVR